MLLGRASTSAKMLEPVVVKPETDSKRALTKSVVAPLKIKGVDPSPYTDSAAVALPLFHSFGRVGCFFSGCCYGVESQLGFMLGGERRFPVQLLSAGSLFALSVILFVLFKKKVLQGKLLFAYLTVYAVGRFFIEFLRGDEIRGKIWIFSTSQFISIIILSAFFIYLCVQKKKTNSK